MSSGYLYILHNSIFKHYGDNVYKLGRTANIKKRLYGYTTSYIEDSEMIFVSKFLPNIDKLEKKLFNILYNCRISPKREFFQLERGKIIEIIKNIEKYITEDNKCSFKRLRYSIVNNNINLTKERSIVDYNSSLFNIDKTKSALENTKEWNFVLTNENIYNYYKEGIIYINNIENVLNIDRYNLDKDKIFYNKVSNIKVQFDENDLYEIILKYNIKFNFLITGNKILWYELYILLIKLYRIVFSKNLFNTEIYQKRYKSKRINVNIIKWKYKLM